MELVDGWLIHGIGWLMVGYKSFKSRSVDDWLGAGAGGEFIELVNGVA